ncbi:MAG: hypothetical protein KKF07_06615 [Candidatus Margulisbacteria bacterium]|nr:hypothetical protein [Candidatus Margulisiibacteriota bacterium]MBU1729906.1 hypothetical protein [Candidatus Margulisiibacteriota bacterium]
MINKFIALGLSIFIVGLGQVFLGKSKKGLILLFLFYFWIPLYLLSILNFSFYLFIISFTAALFVMPILWGYNVIDVLRIKSK